MFNKLLLGLLIYSYIVQLTTQLVIPEDVPTGFAVIFGFIPRFIKGNDHRFGLGFNFGNHADFQLLYEFGPQTNTQSVQPERVRSAYRSRSVRRRPIIEFLLQTRILKTPCNYDHVTPGPDIEPR